VPVVRDEAAALNVFSRNTYGGVTLGFRKPKLSRLEILSKGSTRFPLALCKVAIPGAILLTILFAAVGVPDTNEHHGRGLIEIVLFHYYVLIAIIQHLSAQGTGVLPSPLRRGEIIIQVDHSSHPAMPIRRSPAWASHGISLKSFPNLELNEAKRVPLSTLSTAKRNHLIQKRIFRVIYASRSREGSCSLGFPREDGSSPHGRME